MSWKNNIQVRDMDEGMKLECTCKLCGHTHYRSKNDLLCIEGRAFHYLDEIETHEKCQTRGCQGEIEILLIEERRTSSFIGGLA